MSVKFILVNYHPGVIEITIVIKTPRQSPTPQIDSMINSTILNADKSHLCDNRKGNEVV